MVCCNQGTSSTLKAGDYAIYLDYVVLTQIIPANASPPDIGNYFLRENEVIFNIPLYNTKTGHFRGVKKWLVFIMIRGNLDEVIFSYECNEGKSKTLYASLKHPLPNIFEGTAFKKYAGMLVEEKQNQESPDLFFFLPLTTDRKEKMNKFFGNIHLHPVDFPYDDFTSYSSNNHKLY